MVLLKFFKDSVVDSIKNDTDFMVLHDAIIEYNKEVYDNISIEQLEDVYMEDMVNKLIGKIK